MGTRRNGVGDLRAVTIRSPGAEEQSASEANLFLSGTYICTFLLINIVQYAFQEWNIGVCTFHWKWTFCILGQIFRQIVSIRVMTLINANVVASRHIKREEALLPVAVRHSKTPELNLNFILGNENVTHSAQSELSGRNGFFGGNFLFRISE